VVAPAVEVFRLEILSDFRRLGIISGHARWRPRLDGLGSVTCVALGAGWVGGPVGRWFRLRSVTGEVGRRSAVVGVGRRDRRESGPQRVITALVSMSVNLVRNFGRMVVTQSDGVSSGPPAPAACCPNSSVDHQSIYL
jgi:hypothetical protein